jgi:hypothetical protein
MHTRQSTLFSSLRTGAEAVRWILGLKKLDRMPPVLLRAVSLIDCDLVGVAGGGTLVVLARLPEGCLDTGGLFDSRGSRDSRDSRGSRTDAFLLRAGTSTLRTDADPDPDNGV